jgi:RHS repeat-associated protein
VNFTYDSQSRRIAETVGTNTKLTVYDGWNPIAEYGRAGLQPASLAKTFTWGIDLSGTLQGAGGVGGLLMTSLITNNSIKSNYFPTYDGNGNVSEYLNESGEVSAHYEYDPFGKTTVATGPKANAFAHRFSTKPLDLTTGLYYYGYRFYDPNSGRWPSRDPIEEEGGVNLYGFVFNSPYNWIDVLGGKPSIPGKGGGNKAKSCAKKQASRREFIAKLVGGTEPGNGNGCEIITIIVKLPNPCAKGLDGKGLGGHTGIGIGNDFYDYGPVGAGSNVFGRPGGSYWDGYHGEDLDDILDGIGEIAVDEITGKKLDVIKIEMSVCKDKAKGVKDWWDTKYSDPGTYKVGGDQCTSTVCGSLVDNDLLTGGRTLKPINFAERMAKEKHSCGSNSGNAVKVTHTNVGQ